MSYHWDADDDWDAGVEALRAEVIAELEQDGLFHDDDTDDT